MNVRDHGLKTFQQQNKLKTLLLEATKKKFFEISHHKFYNSIKYVEVLF